VNISPWPKTDQRKYLGVRCKKCKLPILFAIDHSEGADAETRSSPAGKLFLTCPLDTCGFQADYTGTTISSFHKDPAQAPPILKTVAKPAAKTIAKPTERPSEKPTERNDEKNKSRKRS
jgi:hypothetical protein